MIRSGLFISSALVAGFANGEAAGPKTSLELRMDLQSSSTETKAPSSDAVKSKDTSFKIARAKFNFKGSMSPNVSYRLRVDPTQNSVDYAYFDVKYSDTLSVKLGRLFAAYGAVENYYYTDIEVFDWSQTYAPLYFTEGLEFVVTPAAGQTLTVQLLNDQGNTAADTDLTGDTKAFSYVANWMGSFGPVHPIVSYGSTPRRQYKTVDGNEDDAVSVTQISVGAKVKLGAAEVDLDVIQKNTPKYDYYAAGATGTTATTQEETKESALIFQTTYKVNKLKPFFKYRADSNEVTDGVKWDETGLTLGTFYMPDNSGFQYHAAYIATDRTITPAGAGAQDTTVKSSKIIFGMGAYI